MAGRSRCGQLNLYADRASTATMRANQLRLWFASMAYVLLCAVRRIGLHHTPFANATCVTIRLKLLKSGALVRVSVRRIKIAMTSNCPAALVRGCAAAVSMLPQARAAHPTDTPRGARHHRVTIKVHREPFLAAAAAPQKAPALVASPGATMPHVRENCGQLTPALTDRAKLV